MGTRGVGLTLPVTAPRPVVPGGGTGVTPDLAARVAAGGGYSGQAPEKGMLMYGGANLAAAQTDPDLALSFLGQGAGEPFAQTIRGGQATIAQRATAAAGHDAATIKAGQGHDAASLQRQGIHEAGADRRAAAKGSGKGGSGKPLNSAQLNYTDKKVAEAALDAKLNVTAEQRAQVVGRVAERVKAGDDHAVALAETIDEMIETGPETEVSAGGISGLFGGKKTVPGKSTFKPPTLTGSTGKKPDEKPNAAPAKQPDMAAANAIKAQVKAGKISRDEAIKQLKLLGFS
jgi:hypothetical protein